MSGPVLLAALLAAAAVVAAGTGRAVTTARLAAVLADERVHRGGLRRPAWRGLPSAVVAAAAVVGLGVAGAGPLAWLAGAVALAVQHRLRRATTAQQRAAQTQDQVVEICEVLVGELATGRPAAAALQAAADVAPDLIADAARHAALGGDATPLLRAAAERPGAQGLAAVAAAWHLSATLGAPAGAVLDGVVTEIRADLETAREARAQLAPVRSTARLLALLPLLGAALAARLGASPADLVRTGPGQACLLAAVLLGGAGLLWVEQLIARAAPPAGAR
jgi:tight adherence protein B